MQFNIRTHFLMKNLLKNFYFHFHSFVWFLKKYNHYIRLCLKENLKSHLKGKYLFEKTQLERTDSLGYFKILNVKPQITISPLNCWVCESQTIFNAIIKSVVIRYNFTLIENNKCFKRLQ
jgi:hypothetical protein